MSAILKLTTGAYTPDATWDGKRVWLDCTTGQSVLNLPAANTLPNGFSFRLRKADPSSNTVRIKPSASGDRLNHFWTNAHPYGLFMNLSQQEAEISCDGVSDYAMAGMNQHRNSPQSQRTITVPTWNLTPESANEIVRCDVSVPGQDIGIYIDPIIPHWCPVSPITGGNYLSYTVWVQKCDYSAGRVAIIPSDGSRIFPSNDQYMNGFDRGYLYLSLPWQTVQLYIASDGVRVIGYSQSGLIPGAS